MTTDKDYLIDELRDFLFEPTNSPSCDVCGFNWSFKRVWLGKIDSIYGGHEYVASLNLCEDCCHSVSIIENSERVRKYEIIKIEEKY